MNSHRTPVRDLRSAISGKWAGFTSRLVCDAIVTDLYWPRYYLRRFDTQARRCEALLNAVNGVYGFNISARHLDYADPVDASLRRGGYPTLVDGLRLVPSELLAAASSGCR
jgi:hypothetical protein